MSTKRLSVGDTVVLIGPNWNDSYLGMETIVIEDQGVDLLCGERELLVLDPHRPRQIRVYEFDVALKRPSPPQTSQIPT